MEGWRDSDLGDHLRRHIECGCRPTRRTGATPSQSRWSSATAKRSSQPAQRRLSLWNPGPCRPVFIQSKSRQQVKRAAVGAEGTFSYDALATHLRAAGKPQCIWLHPVRCHLLRFDFRATKSSPRHCRCRERLELRLQACANRSCDRLGRGELDDQEKVDNGMCACNSP